MTHDDVDYDDDDDDDILLNISNLYGDVDARYMTPSRNTRSYTLRSVPSSPGRSFFTPWQVLFTIRSSSVRS